MLDPAPRRVARALRPAQSRARRLALVLVWCGLVGAGLPACGRAPPAAAPAPQIVAPVRLETVRTELSILADDSMQGRGTGTAGSARAARFVAETMRAIGLAPAGDTGRAAGSLANAGGAASGAAPGAASAIAGADTGVAPYYQHLPLVRAGGNVRLLGSWAAFARAPLPRRLEAVNVAGVLPGADPAVAGEAVVVDAHYDHLGVNPSLPGDSIYNGADDDASGTVAVLEIARALAAGPRPRRTVVFLATTGEEVGMLGTRWYLAHPAVPLARTVANLEIEMIGRPDPRAGGAGRAWLSGFEHSSMGRSFQRAGLAVVPDPHVGEQFWERSDNIAFARAGVPAHALSSFGLHTDYHQPSDELSGIDFDHMTAVVRTAVRAVDLLANGPAPRWYAGGRPAPGSF